MGIRSIIKTTLSWHGALRFISAVAFLWTGEVMCIHLPQAHAYEDDETPGYINPHDPKVVREYQRRAREHHHLHEHLPALPHSDRLAKFHLALDTIGVPREEAPSFSEFPAADQLNRNEIESLFYAIDPDANLRSYLEWTQTHLNLFQDFFNALISPSLLEFGAEMNATGPNQDSPALINRLEQIAEQAKIPGNPTPLAGLKIVIDPGHMGGDYWDTQTGKFVKIGNKKVSEGEIALWTSMLVAKELEDLGAIVTLTRSEVGTVSKEDPKTFNVEPFFNDYFHRSLDTWMAPYLRMSDADLVSTIKNKPEVKKAYSSIQKSSFYVGGADLEARSQIVDEVAPDVFLDIHFDANHSGQLQAFSNSIEAFVPGGFRTGEVGSRKSKMQALKHLLEVRRFNESVDLSHAVVKAMSKSQGLPLLNVPEFLTSIRVKEGVYARSLYVNRRNLTALTVFLECLHYDHVSEFPKMAKKDRTGIYQGRSFQYPSRIDDIVKGIREGFLNYFQAKVDTEQNTN